MKLLLRTCLLALATVASFTSVALAGDAVDGDDSILTAEMVTDLARVGDVAVAPGGTTVAYTLEVPREADDEPGRSYKQLWLIATDDGDPRQFTAGKERVGAPAFSPDGELVSFLVKRENEHAGVQIWAIPVDGGEARLLTRHDGSVASYRWSPDGKQIAFAAKDAESDDEKEAKEAGRDWLVESVDSKSSRSATFSRRQASAKFRHLHVLEIASGESRRLIRAELDAHRIHWTPDGQTIIFQATTTADVDDEYMNTAIYTLAAGGGTPRVVTPTDGKLGDMAISPDGEQVAFLGAVSRNDPLAQSVFVVPLAGGEARNLMPVSATGGTSGATTPGYEGSGTRLLWRDDGSLLLLAAEGERHALYSLDAESGERAPLALPHLIVRDLDAGGGRLALAAESPSHPAELFIAGSAAAGAGAGAGEPKQRSHHNRRLEKLRLARQETIQWQGADDWTIGGVLTYPLDYREGDRYPLVLQVHGGPEGVSLDGWTTSTGYPVQLLAARGYMVLQPNYRGSGGRGVAFSKADHDDLGGKEFDDILAGVDALIERGLVDADRVGTGGWSYGGYMSAWAATRWTERFAASVVAAGLTNWLSFAGTTDIPYEMSLVHWDSWWFDEPELHWQRSPMAYLNQAKTPTLVVTGAKDERVHPEQARQLFTGLRIKGVPTELVFYPREPHGLRERAHQLDFIERTLGWFDKHLAVPMVGGVEERLD